ncbi:MULTISPECIES: helix-turn-helix domain-containing protein [Lactobacillaceae]|uniref:helix-turn-helix domain-containing protein n=1 Tax=Lactobacillaceae TaxID=33958 RepID=UPI000C1B674C|nr:MULTISPECIES: helix-turn-helix transcriptional regulator [Lactobacillaceae]
MKILGDKIRYYRKLRGISQSELAEGICTQATVSLIEKKDKIPSMEILVRLCERLGITMNLVIVNDDSQIYSIISEIKTLFYHADYKAIAEKLNKLSNVNVNNKQEIKLIHFFNGLVEYEVNHNYDKAIFDFNRAMNVDLTNIDMYDILIDIYTAKSYVNKKSNDEAQVYYDQTKSLINSSVEKINDENYHDSILIYANMSELSLNLGDNDQALKFAKSGIFIAKKEQSLFKLDVMFYILAQAKILVDETPDKALVQAYVISDINDNPKLHERVLVELKQKNLSLFQ